MVITVFKKNPPRDQFMKTNINPQEIDDREVKNARK